MSPFAFPRRGFLRAALAGAAGVLAGCSPVRIVNALVPSDTYTRTRGIAYADHERLKLDVYRPAAGAAAAPVIVFFYGGNWNTGSREDYVFVGEALASRGFVAVLPDYRLYPEVRFPEFLHDCARAVRWAQAHAHEYGGDAQRQFVMGHSAGAYNAAMLAYDPQYLRRAEAERARVRGMIGLAGPYDFLPLQSTVTRGVFGYPDTPPATQPINHVTPDDPPALLVSGTDDAVVDPGNVRRFAARLRAHGVAVETAFYPGLGHSRLAGALAAPFRGFAPVLDDVTRFVRG